MIEQKAKQYFNDNKDLKVLFLFDKEQEFLDEVKTISSPEFKVLFWENTPFTLKYQLTHEYKNENVLLYLPFKAPDNQQAYHDFPLMGLLLANKELQLDNVGSFMEDFGLQRHQKALVAKYMSELKYATVQKVVSPILQSGNFQETQLQQGLLCAFLKFKEVVSWELIIGKLITLLDPRAEELRNRVFQKIDRLGLDEVLLKKITKHSGITISNIDNGALLQLARTLLYNYITQRISVHPKDDYSSLKIDDSSRLTSLNQFWQIVENSSSLGSSFLSIIQMIENDIQGEKLIATYGLDAKFSYYPTNLAWASIKELQHSLFESSNALESLENLSLQQEIVGEAHKVILFLRTVMKMKIAIEMIATYHLDSPEEYVQSYANAIYKVDTHFRKAVHQYDNLDKAEIPDSMHIDAIRVETNKLYDAHIDILNRNWLASFNKMNFEYSRLQIPKQFDFYNTHVATIDQKLVVIISDALRFEVAEELLSRMHGDSKNVAEMDYMMASIPSKTNIGMAQLLPGEKTFVDHEVLSDGIKTSSDYRAKILKKYKENATTVSYDFVKNATRTENRELFKNDLVYVYHDVIDAIGDKRVSEPKTFEAVNQAISELERFVKLLHSSYNVANVLITADHGFLYNDRKIEDKELEKLPKDTLVSHNRFFLTADQQENELGYSIPLGNTTNFSSDLYVNVPLSINRYQKQGPGHQFVHGGASLQELVVPLIKSSRKRIEVTRKVNPLLLNKGKLRVVSSVLKFNILQENEVSRLEKERTITAGLYKESSLVSNKVELTLNSVAEAPSDRLTNVELFINPDNANDRIFNLKIYDVDDQLNPLIDELVTNNTLLGQDF